MPHPAGVDAAITTAARLAAEFDADLVRFVDGDGALPSVSRWVDEVTPVLVRALSVAMRDIGGTRVQQASAVDAAVIVIAAELEGHARRSVRAVMDLRDRVEQVEARPPDDDDDGGLPVGVPVLTAGAVAVAASKRARAKTRGKVGRGVTGRPSGRIAVGWQDLRAVSASVGLRLPPAFTSRAAQVVRTQVAVSRNLYAAQLADDQGLVILVEDARYGATDEPCEDVNGRYATVEWLRRNTTEHPNCTRRGRPTRLPPGRYVTLLE